VPAADLIRSITADPSLTTTLLVASRIAAFVLVAPGFNLRVVPIRIRLLLAVLLTVASTGNVSAAVAVDSTLMPELLVHQAVVGVSLGIVPAVMIWGLQVAASTSQGLTGLGGFGAPEAGPDELLSGSAAERLLLMTTLAVYFAAGGHRQLVQAVLLSFQWLGPHEQLSLTSTQELVIGLLSQSFAIGVRTMCPIIASLSISLLALAIVNRVLPQVGYFAVGMSIQALVLLGSMLLFLGGIAWMWDTELFNVAERVQLAWQQLAAH
jgi:flagellar biosynthetic protein FliR